MAYNQYPTSSQPPQARYYNPQPPQHQAPQHQAPQQHAPQLQPRSARREQDPYRVDQHSGQAQNAYGAPAQTVTNGYDEYSGNPYAEEVEYEDPQQVTQGWSDPYNQAPNTQGHNGYQNTGPGVAYGNASSAPPQPPTNRQRMPPPRQQAYTRDQMNGGQEDPRSRQPRGQYNGRVPASGPRMRGNFAGAGPPMRSRPPQQVPNGAQYYNVSAPYMDEGARSGSRSRSMPRQGGRDERSQDGDRAAHRAGRGLHNDVQRRPGRVADEPASTSQVRNFENPFPVFSNPNAAHGISGNQLDQAPNKPRTMVRESVEIYNGIVADYANDDQYQPVVHPSQARHPTDRYQPRSSPGVPNWQSQYSLPSRPGTAPEAPTGSNNLQQVLNSEHRPRNRDDRPSGDRSISDGTRTHRETGTVAEEMPAFPNSSHGPAADQSPRPRFMPMHNGSHQHLGGSGVGMTSSNPSQLTTTSRPDAHSHPSYSSIPENSTTTGRQAQLSGASMSRTEHLNITPANRQPPQASRGNGVWNQSSPDGPPSERSRHEPPDQGYSSPREAPPQLYRPATGDSHFSDPGPRPIAGNVMPRPQSPMRKGPPGAVDISSPLAPNARPLPSPNASFMQTSSISSARPSVDHAREPVLRSKRSGLPNRANVERPNFYQATGHIAHTPTVEPDNFSHIQQIPTNSPDALPHHATPIRTGPQQISPAAYPPKPPPVRSYNNDPPMTPSAAANGHRPSVPVTLEEISRLQETVQRNPSDSKTQLLLATKLVEAAQVSAGDGGRVNMERERYTLDAQRIVKKLVHNNYPDAMFYLADSYGVGTLGLQNDAKEAFSLYQAAAKLGHGGAAYRTAVCCEIGPDQGGGTAKDLQKAFQWYKRASALGDLQATYKMGIILLRGLLGQEKSLGEAVAYLKRAAERADEENPHALHELGLLYESSKNPGLVAQDDAQALQLFIKAAKLGYKFSQFKLGQAYEYGYMGCKIDARNSIVWYTKGAAQQEHQSELALSGWYLTGSEGILEHSDTEAYLWARKAALSEPPLPKAMFAMGYFTEVGIGCPRSLEEAKRWYGRAAAYKFPKAQERLEELQKGGARAQKNREKLSRSNPKQEADCVVM